MNGSGDGVRARSVGRDSRLYRGGYVRINLMGFAFICAINAIQFDGAARAVFACLFVLASFLSWKVRVRVDDGRIEIHNIFSSVTLRHDEIDAVDVSRRFAVRFGHHGKWTRALGCTQIPNWPGGSIELNHLKAYLRSALPARLFEDSDIATTPPTNQGDGK